MKIVTCPLNFLDQPLGLIDLLFLNEIKDKDASNFKSSLLRNLVFIVDIGKNDKKQLISDSCSLIFVAISVFAVLH